MINQSTNSFFLTDAQLNAEINKCIYCENKACMEACPAHCSPADFILACKMGNPSDYQRASAYILKANPFGTVCGMLCPDTFCMKACVRQNFDKAIEIPKVQSSILKKAVDMGVCYEYENNIAPKTQKIAIIGAGPAGLTSAIYLAERGYLVEIFEASDNVGGALRLIPDNRFNKQYLNIDIARILANSKIKIHNKITITNYKELLNKGFFAVIVAIGLFKPKKANIIGEEHCVSFIEYLKNSQKYSSVNKIAIIGGGAVAVDIALTAKMLGAENIELFVRRSIADMPLTLHERNLLLENKIDITSKTSIKEIIKLNTNKFDLVCTKNFINKIDNKNIIIDEDDTQHMRKNFDLIVTAIGATSTLNIENMRGVFFAGDCVTGESTVVEAISHAKKVAEQVNIYIENNTIIELNKISEHLTINNPLTQPVLLTTKFFNHVLINPFILSAAPHTDGLEPVKKALEAGWAGVIMKTAFDDLDIHIPGGYMFKFDSLSYGNSDNVSDHPLNKVCLEIKELKKLYPNRLIGASTGGPVTGNDHSDMLVWQSNTKKLENAGADIIEYSLSCPQGGDSMEGNIVSQNAELSAKIIDWILNISNPNVPKLFKLTGAVTSIEKITLKIKEVMQKYSHKQSGITLANSFPALAFRNNAENPDNNYRVQSHQWNEGIVVGLSGSKILEISYYSLSQVAKLNLTISGNGGAMNYYDAANMLALGAKTVQFCSIALKYGVNIIKDLENGLSYFLQANNLNSVEELIGRALPNPITDFMKLSPIKQIPKININLCVKCGNCTHCGYMAISLNDNNYPEINEKKCVGCSLCTKNCFTGALTMVDK